ncbi:pyridoxamine 5'-phosphate oxidase [Microlunatus speluncae]|uniref:pyridoxamine 5'-phosphate oxidase n=1 Tax=Microlunatus speluncae TaxID=2594267 RepID=UPI0012667928|nr:pyridoxamine 5'-phosphate oxidase [Microlunatus speluncae]
MNPDLSAERVDYTGDQLLESTAPADPYRLFEAWLADAFAAKETGTLPEPTAMVIGTVADGRPRSRTVLLKEVDAEGFVFYSNYDSAKGAELVAEPRISLLFGWYPLHRQVRVEGTTAPVPRAESEAYFATRPRGSQLGAWASSQSSEITLDELQESYRRAEQRFADTDVPCPPHWGGYRVTPTMIEFWQGRPSRMHDRLRYLGDGTTWKLTRLAP